MQTAELDGISRNIQSLPVDSGTVGKSCLTGTVILTLNEETI